MKADGHLSLAVWQLEEEHRVTISEIRVAMHAVHHALREGMRLQS